MKPSSTTGNSPRSNPAPKNVPEYDIDSVYKKKLNSGLLPGEIILIDWISGKTSEAQFPRYFETTYGINAKHSLGKLIDEGYVAEGTLIESLNSFKIPQLKEALKTKELKVSGKKADLISRIKDHFTEGEIESFVDYNVYKVTTKGEEVLNQYYYIVPAHRKDTKDGIYNVANAIRHVKKFDYNKSNADISWGLFQEASLEYAKKQKYGLMRNVNLHKARQLKREERFNNALFQYLRVFISETSGMWNGNRVSLPKHMLLESFQTEQIRVLMETLEMDEKDLRELFEYTWDRTRGELPYHYLTFEECSRCLLLSMEENEKEIEVLFYDAYKRLNEKYDDDSFYEEFGVHIPYDHQEILGLNM
ncbi:SAP domain-containing protein [Pontibacillus sp. ALD_SL1]|uniref:SAP domain-containing protein n=1 Tax=Pontibacillus sp. ALD_SL1 TaxID=2777185 RepID=UPI001A95F259|nr:SAP domain-containing protein [Pontibacillus sp. ALD_SL1]QSS99544.1 SAP domain-containing protein [Pontibacillus sp. ALD_SL1]